MKPISLLCLVLTLIFLTTGCKRKEAGALHEAAEKGDLKQIQTIIENGRNINVKDRYNRTALHYAVVNSHKDAVELLITNGADVNIKSEEPFWTGYDDYSAASTPLQVSVLKGQYDIVKLLIAKGARVNDPASFNGYTALHFAAAINHKAISELLVANNADVNLKNKSGLTPLDVAMRTSRHEVVKVLSSGRISIILNIKLYRLLVFVTL